MPLTYRIYPDARILLIRGEGVVTQRERIEALLACLEDPDYQHCLDALFDFSTARSVPKVAELRELIAILERRRPAAGPRKLALVTARPIAFALARVFQGLIQIDRVPLQVRVFCDRNQAWTWLRPKAPES